METLFSLIYGRQQCWSYTVRRNSEVRGKWQSFQYIIGKTWSILLWNRMGGYTNASRNVLLKKISLQKKGLLKAYYFKVYNGLTLFVIIIVFIFPQPALLLCIWCVWLPSNGGAHSLILTSWTRQAARNHSGHRRPLLYWSILHLLLSLKRPFVRTALLAWFRKADEKVRWCHLLKTTKGIESSRKNWKRFWMLTS